MWLVLTSLVFLAAMIAPPVAAIWVVLARRSLFDGIAERALLSLALVPLLLLGELFLFTLVPIERPLRALLPWAHFIPVAASLVLLYRSRAVARSERVQAVAACAKVWAHADRPTRFLLLIAGTVLAMTFAWGAWNAGDEHDGAMYRLVMAVQPYQDGVIGPIRYQYSFADAYPRTIELLYSWTLLSLGNSVGLHLVNWYGLVLLGLGTHVLARRAGLDCIASLRCAALVVSTPLPAYLTGVLYNDLASCAPMVAGAAFALPPRGRPWSRQDLLACAACMMIGASGKLTIAIGAGLVVLVRIIACLFACQRQDEQRPRVSLGACLFVFGITGAIAFIPYLRSWILYSSPVWPLRMCVGPFLLFDGPMPEESLLITAKGAWAFRWWTAIYKLFQTTSQDANGSFGLLFAVGVVPGAILFALRTLRHGTTSGFMLCALFFGVLIAPPSTNLRYSLAMLPAGYVMLHLAAPAPGSRRWRDCFSWALSALLFVNAVDYARAVAREAVVQFRWGVSITDPRRNRPWYEQFQWLHTGIDPGVHRHVHNLVRPGERLAYAVVTLGGFLYDPFYTYAIEHRPLVHTPSVETSANSWLASLESGSFSAVLVTRDSPEDQALRNADYAWELIYDQPFESQFRAARIYRIRNAHRPHNQQ